MSWGFWLKISGVLISFPGSSHYRKRLVDRVKCAFRGNAVYIVYSVYIVFSRYSFGVFRHLTLCGTIWLKSDLKLFMISLYDPHLGLVVTGKLACFRMIALVTLWQPNYRTIEESVQFSKFSSSKALYSTLFCCWGGHCWWSVVRMSSKIWAGPGRAGKFETENRVSKVYIHFK